ncbi:MAG: hypothetical protein DRQ60_04820 [Gammaproteobacteria bacterium]|nr:MAG: hypothetical protein DRQ52_09525 [Gammaproteobacteria bacterium]RLA16273.1 MAG: hypothetical protein DRQ60_04820 [Gammaproteobacteria bacterium]RLA20365.1 MAG: hypothetical protein DRQ56_03335 [Gammaproteobacteria bacterium]
MSTIEKANEKLMAASIASQPKPSVDPSQKLVQTEPVDNVTNQANDGYLKTVEASPPILSLNWEKMRALAFLLPDMGHTLLAEQYRKIKHPLLRKITNNPTGELKNNLIMIASALEGEGKSYTAINLAISIAMELDHTALLIDVDSKKSAISKSLDITPELGLSDYLGSADLEIKDIIYSTDIAKLKIIPSGKADLASTEAATSTKMKQFLSEISDRYPDRVIILDTPPLMASAVAKALAFVAGQVVMVVEAEKTPTTVIEEASQYIENNRFAGFILNKTNLSSSTENLYGNYG